MPRDYAPPGGGRELEELPFAPPGGPYIAGKGGRWGLLPQAISLAKSEGGVAVREVARCAMPFPFPLPTFPLEYPSSPRERWMPWRFCGPVASLMGRHYSHPCPFHTFHKAQCADWGLLQLQM